MRRIAVLVVVVFVLLLFTGLIAVNSLSVVQRVTFIDHIRGSVEAREPEGSDFRTLAGEARVIAGTVLRTGKDGEALLHWADGSRLQAGPDTTLTILQCRLNKRTQAALSLFKLDVGRVFIRVIRSLSANSKFEVRTPTATAGVRGTQFAVEVLPDGYTEVRVYEGKVAVAAGSKELGVEAGQALAVSGSQRVTTSRQLNQTDRRTWEANDAAKPLLTVTAPKEGQRVASSRSVIVRGTADPGATVTAAGKSVTAGPDGAFSLDLGRLPPGRQPLVLQESDSHGNQATATVNVQVE